MKPSEVRIFSDYLQRISYSYKQKDYTQAMDLIADFGRFYNYFLRSKSTSQIIEVDTMGAVIGEIITDLRRSTTFKEEYIKDIPMPFLFSIISNTTTSQEEMKITCSTLNSGAYALLGISSLIDTNQNSTKEEEAPFIPYIDTYIADRTLDSGITYHYNIQLNFAFDNIIMQTQNEAIISALLQLKHDFMQNYRLFSTNPDGRQKIATLVTDYAQQFKDLLPKEQHDDVNDIMQVCNDLLTNIRQVNAKFNYLKQEINSVYENLPSDIQEENSNFFEQINTEIIAIQKSIAFPNYQENIDTKITTFYNTHHERLTSLTKQAYPANTSVWKWITSAFQDACNSVKNLFRSSNNKVSENTSNLGTAITAGTIASVIASPIGGIIVGGIAYFGAKFINKFTKPDNTKKSSGFFGHTFSAETLNAIDRQEENNTRTFP